MNDLSKYRVVAIGEILMDMFPDGARLGGAPANVAWHAHGFGATSTTLSRIGRDGVGQEIVKRLNGFAAANGGIAIDDVYPTGTVEVKLTSDGKPTYAIREDVAWDHIQLGARELELARMANAVCFGSLAQRHEVSRRAIHELLGATREECLRVFDVNLRQRYYAKEIIDASLEMANVLKLNDEELPILAEYYGLSGSDAAMVSALAQRFKLRLVAYTRGAEGSLLLAGDEIDEHPGCPATVVDSVGAGDCFAAAVTVGFLAGVELHKINEIANRAAAYVCGCSGATPVLPDELSYN